MSHRLTLVLIKFDNFVDVVFFGEKLPDRFFDCVTSVSTFNDIEFMYL